MRVRPEGVWRREAHTRGGAVVGAHHALNKRLIAAPRRARGGGEATARNRKKNKSRRLSSDRPTAKHTQRKTSRDSAQPRKRNG